MIFYQIKYCIKTNTISSLFSNVCLIHRKRKKKKISMTKTWITIFKNCVKYITMYQIHQMCISLENCQYKVIIVFFFYCSLYFFIQILYQFTNFIFVYLFFFLNTDKCIFKYTKTFLCIRVFVKCYILERAKWQFRVKI